MPYRTPGERLAEDVAVLRGPGDGLDAGESITYWRDLPHSVKGRMTSAATVATVAPGTNQVTAVFDAGIAALTRVQMGIVDWVLFDHEKNLIPWEPDKAAMLVEGLPEDTFMALQRVIGNGAAPVLDAPADPAAPRSETVGNG